MRKIKISKSFEDKFKYREQLRENNDLVNKMKKIGSRKH